MIPTKMTILTSTKRPKLADPQHPAVRAALAKPCPACDAEPRQRCKRLHYRIVHYARCDFRPDPAVRAGVK